MNMHEIGARFKKLGAELKAISERVDYLHVAVMRGDPRFAKSEYAKPDFDCGAFDTQWAAKGRRVPSIDEIFT